MTSARWRGFWTTAAARCATCRMDVVRGLLAGRRRTSWPVWHDRKCFGVVLGPWRQFPQVPRWQLARRRILLRPLSSGIQRYPEPPPHQRRRPPRPHASTLTGSSAHGSSGKRISSFRTRKFLGSQRYLPSRTPNRPPGWQSATTEPGVGSVSPACRSAGSGPELCRRTLILLCRRALQDTRSAQRKSRRSTPGPRRFAPVRRMKRIRF